MDVRVGEEGNSTIEWSNRGVEEMLEIFVLTVVSTYILGGICARERVYLSCNA
ncbi:hypothetical protein M501DRAFT_1002824 [Patellaria atrata CBS 101060]|uniref:Uncharacterized protein n=1 Tax=Patellaria atrata CBS 101060 TaxID=1346257 RepID=A0A9P4SD98_9PEZI|nr:hypothetical protein M501DRAFT_1002824 [Patellaria atrata CBS 101060]